MQEHAPEVHQQEHDDQHGHIRIVSTNEGSNLRYRYMFSSIKQKFQNPPSPSGS
jgi:hypothetical protein